MTDPTVSYGCTHKTNISSVSDASYVYSDNHQAYRYWQLFIYNYWSCWNILTRCYWKYISSRHSNWDFYKRIEEKKAKGRNLHFIYFCLIITTDSWFWLCDTHQQSQTCTSLIFLLWFALHLRIELGIDSLSDRMDGLVVVMTDFPVQLNFMKLIYSR